ncbi:hypothetical protein GGR54DRAFT_534436 [Hypoxylon sp. NC1633]|nr:hypothetical protein GGR54DRAFT_534436 [Hypoxylon sp. NC1633]
MAPSDQPATTVLGRPKPPPKESDTTAAGIGPDPKTVTTPSASPTRVGPDRSSQFEFRGFDFFANRDFNDLKNASRAYFSPANGSEKHQRLPSTWLGDATPPGTPRHSSDAPYAGEATLRSPLDRQTPSNNEKRILGLRRARFWWILVTLILLLIVAIGVGVGVGVGKGSSKIYTTPAAGSSSTISTPSSAMSATTAPTKSLSSSPTTASSPSSAPTGTSEGKIDCPAANGTTYQVPGSDKRFLRICGIDYSGNEAVDLRQVQTESILDCMKNCAGTAECTGCGWGYLEGDTGTQHTCWLKGNLKTPHGADINWAFAVLL